MTPEVRDSLLSELLAKCKEVLSENPNNRCCKHAIQYLNSDEGKNMSNEDAMTFYKCIRTGVDNPDSGLG
eukprot:7874299-Ditylum_brightwellii.AAC.1